MKGVNTWLLTCLIVLMAAISVLFWLSDRAQTTERKTKGNKKGYDSRVAFGKALFFDVRLSSDKSISCVSCHVPEKAFTDGREKSVGVGGRRSFRNAPTLLNIGNNPHFMFDAHVSSLEQQSLVPIQDTNEMNMPMGALVERLQRIPEYTQSAQDLYGRTLDAWVITRALAAYERTLVARNSPVDVFLEHPNEGSDALKRGWQVFNQLECIACHQLPDFTNHEARNNGLYLDYGDDPGKFRIAGDSSLIGAFKVPTLRNIALTAPYMHDGSMKTLDEVVDHYLQGGKGSLNQDSKVKKRRITSEEKKYLLTFLVALTDTSYLSDF